MGQATLEGGSASDGSDGSDGSDASEDEGSGDGGSMDSATGDGDGDGELPRFDVAGGGDAGPGPVSCTVDDGGGDAPTQCEQSAPAESFAPVLQWSFTPDDGHTESESTPLVVNLTDDNDDGVVDLCDTPDIVVTGFPIGVGPARMYALDGATGEQHWSTEASLLHRQCPALGDIDGDGLPEILGQSDHLTVYAFESDGSLKWESAVLNIKAASACLAIADVDNDGDVEIAIDGELLDHEGNLISSVQRASQWGPATILVDLDGDDDMERVFANRAFHHDGSVYYWKNNVDALGRPAVADFDDDGLPEVVVGHADEGISMLEHDGKVKFKNVKPLGDAAYSRPPAVHDIDGDGVPNFMMSTVGTFAVYEPDATVLWERPVEDVSGSAGSTAFDFLGDGGAEAMYGDELKLWAFDSTGEAKVEEDRSSGTVIEYPVVADVDNDGSAEIVVTSSAKSIHGNDPSPYPMVQVFRDADDRWIQARRVWNQHTYHVTNVREDGTIPEVEPKHWLHLNTFRTNAQIENGGVCQPAG